MVPVSRWTQLAGLAGAIALGSAASWLLTPDPLHHAPDGFPATFDSAPVIVVRPPATRPTVHIDLVPVPTPAPAPSAPPPSAPSAEV